MRRVCSTFAGTPGNEMGGCQNYGPFLGTPDNRCRTIIMRDKGTLILTTTQMTNQPATGMIYSPRFSGSYPIGFGVRDQSIRFYHEF